MNKDLSRALVILGVLLALGMSAAAFIFGMQARHIGAGRQNISVKGLAEKNVQANYAEWKIGVQIVAPSFAEALSRLRKARPVLDDFLAKHGFDKSALKISEEAVAANMVEEELPEGRSRHVQRGYRATQSIMVTSKDLDKVTKVSRAALELEADGQPVFYSSPLFLVSNLEDIKMSLIGAATENASKRASEFAKYGGAKVGTMRSASQGAFYILPVGTEASADEYGGTYDKSTIDKVARVVVTIEYNIEH
ncbi:SIMPL domain-containing protein [Undibacterium sp. TS12]|uniref:SIMPL domain-containing protein n=1 Tax=Undibacterium sp. TS12 TaxID=2908202 RepID=UPI001F4D1C3C|nr:SIMPL domain-containing protein [Undibacterium sp. TS12]MCH8622218.1 SIMPL domain-containing protein [Undibacterium sp. TS12]